MEIYSTTFIVKITCTLPFLKCRDQSG